MPSWERHSKRILFLESLAAEASDRATQDNRVSKEAPRTDTDRQKDEEAGKGARRRRNLSVMPGEAGGRLLRTLPPANRPILPMHDSAISIRGRISEFPTLHGISRPRSYAKLVSFVVCVIFPVLLVSIYYVFFASNQYVSEFRFAVTDSNSSSAAVNATSGLSSLLGGITAPNSSQNYLVTDYLTSREVVDQLQSKVNVIKLYSKPSIDWWARFNSSRPIEKFVPYWQSMFTASYDPVTGLAIAQVRAFSAKDANLIASELVKLAEQLVNDIATRPQKDAVRYAENEVRRAENQLKNVRAEMTAYRNKENVIDPNSSVVTSNVTLAQSLRASLVQLQTQLSSLLQQHISKTAPAAQVLQSRIDATKKELSTVESTISKTTNGNRPLSNVVGRYEQLNLELQFAQNMVTSTMQTLEQTRANAAAQHLYITPYVRPTIPESATYPKRISSILLFAFYCITIWLLGMLLFRSIREHM